MCRNRMEKLEFLQWGWAVFIDEFWCSVTVNPKKALLLPAKLPAGVSKGSEAERTGSPSPDLVILLKGGSIFSLPCCLLWVSAFHLWQEPVPMPTFALTKIWADAVGDTFSINLTPDTRNVCLEVRPLSILQTQLHLFFCSNNTSLHGEIQQARSACGALSAGNGTQESVSAFLCLWATWCNGNKMLTWKSTSNICQLLAALSLFGTGVLTRCFWSVINVNFPYEIWWNVPIPE